jgi:hypothetical protein
MEFRSSSRPDLLLSQKSLFQGIRSRRTVGGYYHHTHSWELVLFDISGTLENWESGFHYFKTGPENCLRLSDPGSCTVIIFVVALKLPLPLRGIKWSFNLRPSFESLHNFQRWVPERKRQYPAPQDTLLKILGVSVFRAKECFVAFVLDPVAEVNLAPKSVGRANRVGPILIKPVI